MGMTKHLRWQIRIHISIKREVQDFSSIRQYLTLTEVSQLEGDGLTALGNIYV